jgi:translation initiation factor IF-2
VALPRVYDIAKELGIDSKDAVAKLAELGEFVKSGASTITPPVAKKLREAFPNAKPAPEAPKKTTKGVPPRSQTHLHPKQQRLLPTAKSLTRLQAFRLHQLAFRVRATILSQPTRAWAFRVR